DAAEIADEVQTLLAEETRLGVPAVLHEECLSGYMGPDGTTYPQGIGLASTWEPDLVEGMTERIREQLLAIGTAHALSPVLDVARDPRWGRTEETFGEDQTLVAAMANAYIRGLQGEDPTQGISATAKHFAGHAVGEGGKNRSSVQLGERAFREVHLFPFEAAVREAGVESIMNAYHDVDGVPCTKDESLLTGTLREEWGFDGTVVSDYFSVDFLMEEHGVARSQRDAAVQAVEAGIDVELPSPQCYDELVEAVREDEVSEATIDEAARRVLRQKVEKGLLDDPGVDPAAVDEAFGPEVGRDYARKLARESVTLLKNEDGLLPLEDDASVAVVGPKADTAEGQLGDYAYAAHYPESESDREVVTPLAAFTERLGEERVAYAEGCTTTGPDASGFDDATEAAEGADVALAFVGARSAIALSDPEEERDRRPDVPTSGEGGDVTDLGLPGVQRDLIERLHETDTPVVVVQISGKPHTVTWADEHVPAVVHAWLPGEEGGNGIADVLLADHSPSGRLPISVPKSVGQLPVYYSRKPNSREERHVYVDGDPLYPFGHGLSYTDFEYRDLELDDDEVPPAGAVAGEVTVENAGDVAGHEVVQFYAHQRYPGQARPVQELVGFQRVFLEPGESTTVSVEVPTAKLAYHDADMDLVVEPGAYELRAGHSAADVRSTAAFEVDGDRREVPRSDRCYVAEATVDGDD
ncbi:MAG: glycoside hydrolase family 3 N-terminal domain-containing protein, partial [Haloarculaceae archaeon]